MEASDASKMLAPCVVDSPRELPQWTDLHADALQRVVVSLPGIPDHSDCIQSAIESPAINSVRVGSVTVIVPKASQEFFGTDTVTLIKGAEPVAIVVTQRVSYRGRRSSR